ncbi:MAG: uridine monophosphate kinase [Defluviitaleaceae bacterium]|nr:uridine monophosphate kinase [Defluviitaleaceae bacterium]
MYKRIVIKLSGEALSGANSNSDSNGNGNLYDTTIIDNIIADIKYLTDKGVQICLAIGGGNIWRGRNADHIDKTKADQMGMLATVINSMYLCERLIAAGQTAQVFTPFSVGTFTTPYSKEAAERTLKDGGVVIFGGGLGHPFFSTDTVPVLRACELNCDCVFFAKNINGVYDKNPITHPDAVRYKSLTYREIIEQNFEVIDIAAMVLCENNNIPSIVFSLTEAGSIRRAALDKDSDVGTIISV